MGQETIRVLVTGGAGFIGSHLAEALVAEGTEVTILDNLSTGSMDNLGEIRDRVVFVQGDIRDRSVLESAVEDTDAVFHLAAMVSVPRSVEDPVESAMINDIGTLSVLEAARRAGTPRVVLSSSCAVYGDSALLPKQETMAPEPLSPYALQKLNGEGYARLYHELHRLDTVCLRYFNVYGPRQDPSSDYSGVISLFMTRAVLEESPVIYGDGRQYRDFVFVKDVVKANLLALGAPHVGGKLFNVGTGDFVRINDLWEKIRRLSGVDIKPQFASPRPGDILESVADIGHVVDELGFFPEYSFDDGLEITFDWYKKQR
jgi:nucleoside-diphosphate-sugar epimerase